MENARSDFPPPARWLRDGKAVFSWAERGCGGMGERLGAVPKTGRSWPAESGQMQPLWNQSHVDASCLILPSSPMIARWRSESLGLP